MNQGQRKQRLARIHREQKVRKILKKQQDVEQLVVMAEEFVESDKEFVDDYTAKAGCAKKKVLVLTTLCVIFVAMLVFGINIGTGKTWNVILFWIMFTLMAMYLSEYWLYRDRLPFWKQQLQENTEFLQYARSRL